MHIDFKLSVWERAEIPEGKEEIARKLIESGEVTTANQLFEKIEGCNCEYDTETEQYLSPSENENESTIELFEEDGQIEPTWKNA